jgi:hypothetical protein
MGTFVQVPAVPARLQDAQVPLQVDEQQTPCWQSPEAHWAVPVQAVPSGCRVQVPPLQMLGDAQSLVTMQVVLQTGGVAMVLQA